MSQPNAHVEARRRHIPAQLAQLCGSPPTVQPDHPDAFVQKIHSAHADVWCGAHAMCQGHRVSQRHRRGSGVVGCLALVVRRATVFQSHPYVLPEVSAASPLGPDRCAVGGRVLPGGALTAFSVFSHIKMASCLKLEKLEDMNMQYEFDNDDMNLCSLGP